VFAAAEDPDDAASGFVPGILAGMIYMVICGSWLAVAAGAGLVALQVGGAGLAWLGCRSQSARAV
jgi:hypothetical protein